MEFRPKREADVDDDDDDVMMPGKKDDTDKSFAQDDFAAPKKSGGKSAALVTTIAIAFVALGFAGGFFGFKYSPKIAKLFTATADTETTPSTSDTATSAIGKPKSTATTADAVAAWPIYSNTSYLYSLKYPDNWYSKNANDPASKDVIFSSTDPATGSDTGMWVEASIEALNGKDLKTWIEANNTTSNIKADSLTELTIGSETAYQQIISGTTKSISTYIGREGGVLVVTYTAPEALYTTGVTLYNDIIGSIKLT